MKKLLAIVLSLLMVMSLAVPAMAVENTATGTITVQNTVKDVTYNAYKILDIVNTTEVADTADELTSPTALVTYTVDADWADFFDSTKKPAGVSAWGSDYIVPDTRADASAGYVVWKYDVPKTADNVQAFAQAALDYAKSQNLTPDGSATSTADNSSVVIEGMKLGYYVIDSSLGALCALDSTTKNAVVKEKNDKPSIDKKVNANDDHSDSADPDWKDANTAKIGDTVEYRAVITISKGSAKLKIEDTMEAGLTYDSSSFKVVKATKNPDDTYTDGDDVTDWATDVTSSSPDVTFAKEFTESEIKNYAKDETVYLIVYYNATLNADAVIFNDTNDNSITLRYGDDFSFEDGPHTTQTKTFEFDLLKYTGTEAAATALAGAKFSLYDAATAGNLIKLVETTTPNTYRVATSTDTSTVDFIVTPEGGKIQIEGLDNKTYYLEETEAPAGYNKLDERVEVKFSEDDNAAVNLTGVKIDTETNAISGEGIKVLNQSGSELPETGGIGTTIFYVVGGLMMAVAVVLLVTKKKVNGK